MANPLRVGLVGAGANTRSRHVPGLRAVPGVEIVAVCNRRPESTAAAARELGIPRTFERWEDLVADPGLDAVVVGTWPYLHCPVTLAALEAGKHVLTEARLSLDAAEAHRMLAASRRFPHLVTQVVPSPYGLVGHRVVLDLIDSGYLGELREAKRRLADRLPESLPEEVVRNELLMGLIRGLIAPEPADRFPDARAADLIDAGAASFQRQLVRGDLASEYDDEIRAWLEELDDDILADGVGDVSRATGPMTRGG